MHLSTLFVDSNSIVKTYKLTRFEDIAAGKDPVRELYDTSLQGMKQLMCVTWQCRPHNAFCCKKPGLHRKQML